MPIQILMTLIRALGLAQAFDYLRFTLAYWFNLASNLGFKKEFPAIKVPPPYLLYESFRMNYRRYWESGRETACWIKTETSPFMANGPGLKILDWGCGPARVLRHLPDIFGPENGYHGMDYNPATVAWCREVLNGFTIAHCPLLPPTSCEDQFFDLIYGISVFTHLPENAHYQWREELFRISKPGAVLLMTMQGPAFLEKMTPEEKRQFHQQHLIVRGNTRAGHRTFSAFHPETWARSFFEERFEILRYIPGKKKAWGIEQDTWVLRRPNQVK